MLSDITGFLASIWSAFSNLQVPLLGISFATLYAGVFAVGFSILILRPILGIGEGFVKGNHKMIRRRPKYTTNNYGDAHINIENYHKGG